MGKQAEDVLKLLADMQDAVAPQDELSKLIAETEEAFWSGKLKSEEDGELTESELDFVAAARKDPELRRK